mmetsp:Transcript_92971/g.212736  ORF Transcript_92971/g.212736 Transcript_92971/m.212736 type:complete len:295 (+) Transcript_92971:7-891(+)
MDFGCCSGRGEKEAPVRVKRARPPSTYYDAAPEPPAKRPASPGRSPAVGTGAAAGAAVLGSGAALGWELAVVAVVAAVVAVVVALGLRWRQPGDAGGEESAVVEMPGLARACLQAAATLELGAVLEVLDEFGHLLSQMPGGGAARLVYDSQVANVRRSPVQGSVPQILKAELNSEAHAGWGPPQMNPKTVSCELYWAAVLAVGFGSHLIAGARVLSTEQTMQDAALDAYAETFEAHHGWLLRQTFTTAFWAGSGMDVPAFKRRMALVDVGALQAFAGAVAQAYAELGLEDLRRV